VSEVLLIRHGRTSWNERGCIQGHEDIGLSDAGRAVLAACRIPREYAHLLWYASPLTRAVESARILGARDLQTDARLVELHWGEWQGWTRDGLREHHGQTFAEAEARGLDFRPPGGESSRELRHRLEAWLSDIAAAGQAVVAVTHKGVIQMALSMATGWDLVSRAPARLDWQCAQLFSVTETPLRLQVVRLNVALAMPATSADADNGSAGR